MNKLFFALIAIATITLTSCGSTSANTENPLAYTTNVTVISSVTKIPENNFIAPELYKQGFVCQAVSKSGDTTLVLLTEKIKKENTMPFVGIARKMGSQLMVDSVASALPVVSFTE